jgi:hypothetical protein
MAALKKTAETTAGSRPRAKASSSPIKVATAQSTPVESGAQQLRLHLETALAASQPEMSLAEPAIETWPRPVRVAILAGAIILPWSLIVLAAHALLTCPVFPWVY